MSVAPAMAQRRAVEWSGAALGAVVLLGAGLLAGDWWWAPAALGSIAAAGAVVDRQLGNAQVLAALVLVAGVVAVGRDWYVVVLAGGTIGSIELLARVDRLSVVREQIPDLAGVARVVPGVALLAGGVLLVGAISMEVPAGGAVVGAAAAVLGLRVMAR